MGFFAVGLRFSGQVDELMHGRDWKRSGNERVRLKLNVFCSLTQANVLHKMLVCTVIQVRESSYVIKMAFGAKFCFASVWENFKQ